MSTNPITRNTDCLALLQSRQYTGTELYLMMKTPTEYKKCIHCGDRDCYGKCDAQRLCDCKEPCKADSCGAHWLFQKMSERNGAHPHFYSVENYCTECERLGCRCCTECKLYHQCNCYGQLDNDESDCEADCESDCESDCDTRFDILCMDLDDPYFIPNSELEDYDARLEQEYMRCEEADREEREEFDIDFIPEDNW